MRWWRDAPARLNAFTALSAATAVVALLGPARDSRSDAARNDWADLKRLVRCILAWAASKMAVRICGNSFATCKKAEREREYSSEKSRARTDAERRAGSSSGARSANSPKYLGSTAHEQTQHRHKVLWSGTPRTKGEEWWWLGGRRQREIVT